MTDFETSIKGLDTGLFDKIESQSTEDDKRSLLACQAAVRELHPAYTYLEIGSHLGGSIQPHLLDPDCKSIYSIDKRSPSQPDARGFDWKYENNSTERMMSLLREVSDDVGKVHTLDGHSRSINPGEIKEPIQLCFIDGEHTDEAAETDFAFCLKVLGDNGAIMFHDAHITYIGITTCIQRLRKNGTKFNAYPLPNALFVVEIGSFPLHKNGAIEERLRNNYDSYLYALRENDNFRRFANRFPFGTLRRLRLRIRGGNVSS